MKITFWGAAKTVTGSMHQVDAGRTRWLFDCGLYQGRRQEAFERNSRFPFPASSVDAVILSHAHIDHSGNLPTLVRCGFRGPIYATPATVDLSRPMLADSAYLQEKDAEFVNKRREFRNRKGMDGHEAVPLYTAEDAERTFPLFSGVPLGVRTEIAEGVAFETFEAGHMLGSSAVLVEAGGIRLAFSGDIGRPGLPILRDPVPLPPVDYLIMESTYGDRFHKPLGNAAEVLARIVNETAGRGGKIIVPAFAVGRTQQLVLILRQLALEKRIPSIPIFVDSPLAINVTEVYRNHSECYDEETRRVLESGDDPFWFERLTYVREAEASKKLNDLRGPCIIIAASGMCEAGRILHHLRNNIEDPRNTVLITGFQAENTLGRKILERQPEVRIFGEPMRLRANVHHLNELSGHADQGELLKWLRPAASSIKKIFLVHGEPRQQAALALAIEREFGLEAAQPSRGESFELS